VVGPKPARKPARKRCNAWQGCCLAKPRATHTSRTRPPGEHKREQGGARDTTRANTPEGSELAGARTFRLARPPDMAALALASLDLISTFAILGKRDWFGVFFFSKDTSQNVWAGEWGVWSPLAGVHGMCAAKRLAGE